MLTGNAIQGEGADEFWGFLLKEKGNGRGIRRKKAEKGARRWSPGQGKTKEGGGSAQEKGGMTRKPPNVRGEKKGKRSPGDQVK